jgi:hypothetical protein
MVGRFVLLIVAALIACPPGQADELRLSARRLIERSVTDGVTLAADGAVIEIERGVLYEDDGPAAGYCYGPNEERLAGGVAIKKELQIDRPAAAKAWLLVAPGGELAASINGRPAVLTHAGKAGQYWQQYEFDPALLMAGKNAFVLSGSGKVWIARDEDFAAGSRELARHPNRSAKSTDGGKTWSDEKLGTGGDLDGEYYVRVFLDQVRASGSLTLPVLDAGNLASDAIAPQLKSVGPVRVAATGRGPLPLQFRSGTTFVPAKETWTDWQSAAEKTLDIEKPAGRYFQVRIELLAEDGNTSPRLESLTIHSTPELASDWRKRVRIVGPALRVGPERKESAARRSEPQGRSQTESPGAATSPLLAPTESGAYFPSIVRSSIPFEYEPFDQPRLKKLREGFKLDEVVAGATTELELIGRLAAWSSQQWDKGHLNRAYPPWDAYEILKEHADGTPVGGFCQQYNVVFLQACESFGLVGRAVSLGPGDSGLAKIRGGHEVVEIWSNEFAKWIYVDGNAAWYFVDEASGTPLSLRELRQRQLDAFTTVGNALRSVPPVGNALRGVPPATKLVKLAPTRYEWAGLTNWPPFLELRLIPRSNFLESAAPLPLNQGMRGWFWTGHHVWTDERAPASLLYGHRVSQPGNWDWTLNHAQIVLTATQTPGELAVELDTVTPSLAAFWAKFNNQPPREVTAAFRWPLVAGRNRFEVWPRNTAGRDGVRSSVELMYSPE